MGFLAFKTSYVDREESPATVNPRDLAVGVSTSKAVETPQTRDSNGPDAMRYDTSITTTEVVPSEPDEASFTRGLSPADRPGMLGRELLQSASEIVKRRQRPKAKPLALASKEVRAAIRGESPPRDIEKASEKDKSNARKEKAAEHSEDDDDDELRLKTTKTKKTASEPSVSYAAVDTASGRVIDIDSDDTDEPLRRPRDGAKKAKAKTTKKGKSCQESDEDASAEERAYERMRREIEQANAKESEDDDDYGAKPNKAKGKRKKKEKEQAKKRTTRRDSVLLSEDTASEAPTRPSRSKGRPSAIFPSSKKGKSRASVDDNEDEDEEPVQVLSARKPSKATKDMKASTSKETHSKQQERAREDSVDAAKPAASLTCNHRSQAIMGKLNDPNGPVEDDSETDTLPLAPSSDASGSLSKAKVTKKYGKKAKKSALRVEESEEEEEYSDEARRTGVDGNTSDVTKRPPLSKGNGNDSRKTSGSSSGTGIKRPAFELVIDNSARESRSVPRASSAHKAQGSHSGNGSSGLNKISVEVAASVEGDTPQSQPEDQENRHAEDPIEQDLYKSAAQAPVDSTDVKSDARGSVLQASDGNTMKTKVRAQDLVKSEQKLSTPAKILAGSGNSADVKSAVRSTGKRELSSCLDSIRAIS